MSDVRKRIIIKEVMNDCDSIKVKRYREMSSGGQEAVGGIWRRRRRRHINCDSVFKYWNNGAHRFAIWVTCIWLARRSIYIYIYIYINYVYLYLYIWIYIYIYIYDIFLYIYIYIYIYIINIYIYIYIKRVLVCVRVCVCVCACARVSVFRCLRSMRNS